MLNQRFLLTAIALLFCSTINSSAMHKEEFGTMRCSPWYEQKAYEFLEYFDIQNPEKIEIYKFTPTRPQDVGNSKFGCIWFDEKTLDQLELNMRLWTIAHETAHIACGHDKELFGSKLLIAYSALLPAVAYGSLGAFALCKLQNSAFFENVPLMKTLFLGSCLGLAIGVHTVHAAEKAIKYINNYTKSKEREADLKAATMLCQHGCRSVVESEIAKIEEDIASGIDIISDDHPKLGEKLMYLKEFINNHKIEVHENRDS